MGERKNNGDVDVTVTVRFVAGGTVDYPVTREIAESIISLVSSEGGGDPISFETEDGRDVTLVCGAVAEAVIPAPMVQWELRTDAPCRRALKDAVEAREYDSKRVQVSQVTSAQEVFAYCRGLESRPPAPLLNLKADLERHGFDSEVRQTLRP